MVVAAVAGLVDAIAGGGGLLTVPALLATGLPPHVVLGTNKGAAVFGSGSALVRFAHAGLIDRRAAVWLFVLGAAGSVVGVRAQLLIDEELFRPVVLGLLLAAGVVVAFVKPKAPGPETPRPRSLLPAYLLAGAVGAYDGFFGPGTGTFLIIGFVMLLHFTLQEASANAKVVNFASNVAAMALFAWEGAIVWRVALPMAVGQLVGGALGAQVAVRGGDRIIRRVVLVVVVALVAKLSFDAWRAGGRP